MASGADLVVDVVGLGGGVMGFGISRGGSGRSWWWCDSFNES